MVTSYQIVDIAQPGSDIHGVLEKIAYRFHLADDRYESNCNWNNAKAALSQWMDNPANTAGVSIVGNESYLNEVLNFRAYRYMNNGGTPFDHWISAQNDLAEQIAKNYLCKTAELNRQVLARCRKASTK